MRIFITGVGGFVGSTLTQELLANGHQVVGLARSDGAAAKAAGLGAEIVRGSLGDLDLLRETASRADGVAHLAFSNDFSNIEAGVKEDGEAIAAIGEALVGSGKPFVVTGGSAVVPGQVATESDESLLLGPLSGRITNIKAALALADQDVRSSTVGLPRSVHGTGGNFGLVSILVAVARGKGVSGYPGDGSNRWPAVHVKDAARLYRLALEQGPAGSRLHAVAEEGIALKAIAEALGTFLNLPTASVAPEEFGPIGPMFAIDQPASATRTRELLGWEPTEIGLIEDIETGGYTR
jgi:nucleoside-diphosphate-sugar epimerase